MSPVPALASANVVEPGGLQSSMAPPPARHPVIMDRISDSEELVSVPGHAPITAVPAVVKDPPRKISLERCAAGDLKESLHKSAKSVIPHAREAHTAQSRIENDGTATQRCGKTGSRVPGIRSKSRPRKHAVVAPVSPPLPPAPIAGELGGLGNQMAGQRIVTRDDEVTLQVSATAERKAEDDAGADLDIAAESRVSQQDGSKMAELTPSLRPEDKLQLSAPGLFVAGPVGDESAVELGGLKEKLDKQERDGVALPACTLEARTPASIGDLLALACPSSFSFLAASLPLSVLRTRKPFALVSAIVWTVSTSYLAWYFQVQLNDIRTYLAGYVIKSTVHRRVEIPRRPGVEVLGEASRFYASKLAATQASGRASASSTSPAKALDTTATALSNAVRATGNSSLERRESDDSTSTSTLVFAHGATTSSFESSSES
ncbi:hypothetical protein K438DRAFT_1954883 [Mycena galopus ATCC 62051]|nr:hypothetical protein K438DRAFT_1954883 [Mycena galopus ATCC 62051]